MPTVAQHGHNRVSGAQLPRSAHGTNAVEGSRTTNEEPLLRVSQCLAVGQSGRQSSVLDEVRDAFPPN